MMEEVDVEMNCAWCSAGTVFAKSSFNNN